MTKSEDHKWREIQRRLGLPGATGLERSAIFDLGLFEHDADSLRLEADQLHKDFKRGDKLAPFECCWLWREAGLDPAALPNWVLDCLLKIAADYYADAPDVTPRALLDMSSKERAKVLPSLDRIAGLRGVQRRPDAWSWRAEHDRDPYVADVIEGLRRWAREGGDPSSNATQTECLARQNLWRKRNGETVRILDVHGRMRSDVLNDVGRAFRVGGYSGEAGDKSKTVRDRIRRTAK